MQYFNPPVDKGTLISPYTGYTNDIGAGRYSKTIQIQLDLMGRGLDRGYFPDPTKSILVISGKNVQQSQMFFRGMGLKVVTGNLYLRVFIGDEAAEEMWLGEKIWGWEGEGDKFERVFIQHQ